MKTIERLECFESFSQAIENLACKLSIPRNKRHREEKMMFTPRVWWWDFRFLSIFQGHCRKFRFPCQTTMYNLKDFNMRLNIDFYLAAFKCRVFNEWARLSRLSANPSKNLSVTLSGLTINLLWVALIVLTRSYENGDFLAIWALLGFQICF